MAEPLFRPGPMTRDQADRLNAVLEMLLDRAGPSLPPIPPINHEGGYFVGEQLTHAAINPGIRVRITSTADSEGFQAWDRVTPVADEGSADEAWTAYAEDQHGTQSVWPAYEANGNPAGVGEVVEIRRSYFSSTRDWTWVYDRAGSGAPGSASTTIVTNVNVINITVNVSSSGSLIVNNLTPASVPGASTTITLTQRTCLVIFGSFTFAGSGTAAVGDVYAGQLLIDGVAQDCPALWTAATTTAEGTVVQVWETCLDAGAHDLQLQGYRKSGTGSASLVSGCTKLIVHGDTKLNKTVCLLTIPGGTLTCPSDGSTSGSGVGPGGDITTTCCPDNPLPTTLYGTFTGGTGGAAALNGQSVLLEYNGLGWYGTYEGCGGFATLGIACAGPNWTQASTGVVLGGSLAPDVAECDPLVLEFTDRPVSNLCTGTVTLLVTE